MPLSSRRQKPNPCSSKHLAKPTHNQRTVRRMGCFEKGEGRPRLHDKTLETLKLSLIHTLAGSCLELPHASVPAPGNQKLE